MFQNAQSSAYWVERFLKAQTLSSDEEAIVKAWSGAHKDYYYFVDETENFAVLYGPKEGKAYGVKALSDPLSFTARDFSFPVKLYYTILPYKDFYIMDGIGPSENITELKDYIRIYEGYRKATLDQPMMLSPTATQEVIHCRREPNTNPDIVFEDYLHPLLYYIVRNNEFLEEAIRYGLAVWNGEMVEHIDGRGRTMWQAMQKRRKQDFGIYTYLIDQVYVTQDKKGRLMFHVTLRNEKNQKKEKEAKHEQLSLFEI